MSKRGGHHGGAWKVAYADFVTAMMALFLVLWLTAQDEKIKEAVERAFRNPFTSLTKESVGIIASKEKTQAVQSTSGNFDSASAVELSMLRRLNQDLLTSLQGSEDISSTIKMDLAPDGLRISIFDRSRRPVFQPNATELTEYGNFVFSTLAWNISRYPTFAVELEGHTERGQQPIRENYGAWELSSDRANAGRRALLEHGVAGTQFHKVGGYSDKMPLPDRDPTDESNRRVTVLLRVQGK